ncbi:GNAT family N-acetyltransferase [Frondihabitans australicus]|uniref:GNAT family N-acetyltransferase n=1 Tax=Frondihabitans australicus TaxID=386892 RepID=UPI003CCC88B1
MPGLRRTVDVSRDTEQLRARWNRAALPRLCAHGATRAGSTDVGGRGRRVPHLQRPGDLAACAGARYTSLTEAEAMIERSRRSHATVGLGTWAVRLSASIDSVPAGTFVGTGGMLHYDELGVFNLGYRLAPEAWGLGIATELVVAAREHAARLAPEIRVSARVLLSNPASVRVLEKAGLEMLWEGPSREARGRALDPAPVLRRIYGDRVLPPRAMDWFIEHS